MKTWQVTAAACLALFPAAAAQIIPPTRGPFQVPSATGTCAVAKPCAELAPGMLRSALAPSPLEENLRYLTDFIGGRLTGSPAADRATGWAVEAFRHAGVDEVRAEKFTVAAGWSEGRTRAEVLAPAQFSLRLVSTGWSPALPEGGITADVVDVGAGDDAGFASAGEAVKAVGGTIVLVHTNIPATWEDIRTARARNRAIADRAKIAGAAAIFWMSARLNLLLGRETTSADGQLESLPQAVVAREDAERIARLLAVKQEVRVHFEMPNRASGPAESENVVAEIRGREKPEEYVLVGAHLDSWDLGTGALDDGANAAALVDAARVIHASGSVPRCSIRFALFTGNEQGMLGSRAYARTHQDELGQIAAAVIFDRGAGPVMSYSLGGRKDALAPARDALDLLQSFGVKEFTLDADSWTDALPFELEGVPTLVARQEMGSSILDYHAASDTFDKVDVAAVKHNVAVVAVTAYALADAAERIGPRQSRAETEELLKQTGLGDEMKLEGLSDMWQGGGSGH